MRILHILIMGSPVNTGIDWSEWSRVAVRLMQQRNDDFVRRFALKGRRYEWDLHHAVLLFPSDIDTVAADLCVIGSISESEGTFLWAWANDSLPEESKRGLDHVREFGRVNNLTRLIEAEWPGGSADGLEMAAAAARILDAEGVWVAPMNDVTMYFALRNIRRLIV